MMDIEFTQLSEQMESPATLNHPSSKELNHKSLCDNSNINNSQHNDQNDFNYCTHPFFQGQSNKGELNNKRKINNMNSSTKSRPIIEVVPIESHFNWQRKLGHELSLIANQFHSELLKIKRENLNKI